MRKRKPNCIICFILTFLLLSMNIPVFADTVVGVSTAVHVTKVSLSKTSDTLIVGGTDTLKATISPTKATNKNIKWISSNSTIAKVDGAGKITSLKMGTATITATTVDKALKATCKVTVNPVVHVNRVSLSKTADTLIVGGTDTLKATISPTNATNKAVKWISSNAAIAKVDGAGKITSLKMGTATITATTVDKALKAACKVTVNPVVHVNRVSLSKTADTLIVGGTDTLKATISPTNATNKAVKWTSSNVAIAKVDGVGKITSLKVGIATITVTTVDKVLKAICKVTVNPVVHVTKVSLNKSTDILTAGGTDTLKATIAPTNATNKAVRWTSSNAAIAKVDSTGKVTSLKAGTSIITAISADGSKIATCTVTVRNPAIRVTSLHLYKITDTLTTGYTDNLTVMVSPSNAANKAVTWKTSDTSVATVGSTGIVTAIKPGHAIITVTTSDGSKTSTCIVTVINPPLYSVLSVALNKTTDALIVGNTDNLVATVAPSYAANKAVIWESSDSSVATVDSVGRVTAIKPGDVTISVTTANLRYKASCIVTVNPVYINITNKIKDANFKQIIYTLIGKNNCDPILYSDVRKITTLRIDSKYIKSLDGIEYFDSLRTLDCYDNQLTSLDTSHNTVLKYLCCSANQLVDLKVNTALTDLDCASNHLTNLDISKNAALSTLFCETNQFTSLDISKNTAITKLACTQNQLINLDISNNSNLIELNCNYNELTNLKASNNKSITSLNCSHNKITDLDASNDTALTVLDCEDNQITHLDISNDAVLINPVVKVTSVGLNKTIDNLTVGSTDTLIASAVPNNAINKAVTWTSTDSAIATVDSTGKVTVVKAGTAIITATTIDGGFKASCTVKSDIDITNKFTDANFKNVIYALIGKSGSDRILYSDVRNIKTLNISNKSINSLNGIEYFDSLTDLNCSNNKFTSLDTSNNTALTTLDCSTNFQLKNLDVSKNIALTTLSCYMSGLTNLNVSKNAALTYLECEINHLTSLDVSKNTFLTHLDCRDSHLTSLDVSKNTALTYLYCYDNHFTNLDVSKNTALTTLHCGYNYLTSLDISKNVNLVDFKCTGNQITTLYSIKNTWSYEQYMTQYTDSTNCETTDRLVISIKY